MNIEWTVEIQIELFVERTQEAMGGSMTFREALRRRLAIIKPSAQLINKFNEMQPSELTPGIEYVP